MQVQLICEKQLSTLHKLAPSVATNPDTAMNGQLLHQLIHILYNHCYYNIMLCHTSWHNHSSNALLYLSTPSIISATTI